MRFCQASQTANPVAIDCGLAAVLNDNKLPNDFKLDAQNPWHRVHTQPNTTPSKVTFDADVTNRLYGKADFTEDWAYSIDLTDWLTGPNAPFIPGCASASDPLCLRGSWWVNGSTRIGIEGETDPVTTQVGTHVPASYANGNIADGVTPISPVSQVSWCLIIGPPFDPPPGTGPIGWGPGKLVVVPSPLTSQLDVGAVGDARFLIASAGGVVASLQTDGTAIAGENIGGANCGGNQVNGVLHDVMFSTNAVWLNAAEPSTAIPGLGFGAIAVSLDGTQMVATLSALPVIGTSGASPFTGALVDASSTGAADPLRPSSRTGYAAAYSRFAGGIFVAGGESLDDDATLHDVWFRAPSGTWTDVTPHVHPSCTSCNAGRELGTIRAITFSYADHKLWIVDEVPGPKLFSRMRLLRASPGGALEELASWTKLGVVESYFLSVDHDGAPLLSMAKVKGQGFTATRIEIDGDGTGRVAALYVDTDDKLLGPAFVSPVGYGFFVQHGQTQKLSRAQTLSVRHPHRDLDEAR